MEKTDAKNDATINVRIPAILKQRGEAVLRKNKVSVSDAMRSFYEYLATEQRIPDFIEKSLSHQDDLIKEQRRLLRMIAGITSGMQDKQAQGSELFNAKAARLKRQLNTGVRE
ncbi:MAG: hypothetical protein LBC35_00265 [Coriobacteriales bacterium]|jgi:antitoxin component of RelBE/YafQ-DinJ toxin-antitoxin module|nr:hypothetical protein [Coriobacteriales bacterium]